MTDLPSQPSWSEADDVILRTAVMDLHRLLRCMEQQEAPPDLTWQSIQGRANLAQSLWIKVQQGWHMCQYENEALRAEDEARYVKLERQVDQACRRAREIAAERKGNEVDIIQEIFFPKNKKEDSTVNEEKKESAAEEEEEEQDAASVESSRDDRRHQSPQRRTPVPMSSTAQNNVEELQKAQREQLEEEIAHMAARLKESTKSMNTTLRAQTEELGEMEDLATKNVDKVGTVADNVTEHNKRSWRNTLGKWTIIFAVLGSFLFCMMTIRMVPKQRNKCLFFCGTTKSQKEVCNQMEDGSIVCVDTKGNPYVKKVAPVSRRESEYDEECEVGDDGECAVPSTKDSNADYDAQEENVSEEEVSTDDVCREEGECLAQYDDPEPTGGKNEDVEVAAERIVETPQGEEAAEQVGGGVPEEETSNDDACSEEGECMAQYDDNPEPSDAQKEDAVVVIGETAEQVDNDGQVDGSPPTDVEADDPAASRDQDEDPLVQIDDEPNDGETVASGGAHLETEHAAETEAVVTPPVSEPTPHVQEEANQEGRPTVERETSFRPAEISTFHERFDDVDEKGDLTYREVQLATQWGKHYAVEEYLRRKPEHASFQDENGWQLIHEAAAAGHVEIMAMLLDEYNADINARAGLVSDGATPLFLAFKHGYDESSEVVRFIVGRGGVNIAPGENTPYKPASALTPEELEQYNMEDLHLAAAKGDDIRVAQYVEARPDLISSSDPNGWLALHESIRYGHLIATRLLINAGSDVNARTGRDGEGWSPLGLALQRLGEEHPVTQLLRRYDAEVHIPED